MVAKMTPDQVYHRLCKEEILKRKRGKRTTKLPALGLAQREDGCVLGRAADGSPIVGRIAAKSKAAQLREQQDARS